MTTKPDTYAAQADSPTFTFIKLPPVAGYWIFPGASHGHMTKLPAYGKPSRLHRFAMSMVFGFKWEDA